MTSVMLRLPNFYFREIYGTWPLCAGISGAAIYWILSKHDERMLPEPPDSFADERKSEILLFIIIVIPDSGASGDKKN